MPLIISILMISSTTLNITNTFSLSNAIPCYPLSNLSIIGRTSQESSEAFSRKYKNGKEYYSCLIKYI